MSEAPTPNGPLSFPRAYAALQAGTIDAALVRACFDAIFAGQWSAVQIAAFLGAFGMRPETAETLTAAAQALRAVMVPVAHTQPLLLDTCGTGGDSSGSLNLSTGAAIICAAAGVPVAKHGNRAATSKAGSADVLQALGISLELGAEASAKVLDQVGIAFLIAPTHHPAMRFAGPVRKELGIRTLFNCLGPLANPAGATHQLLGAFSDSLRPLLAEALLRLGSRRAWVVWGQDGLDEVSPYGPSSVTEVNQGKLREFVIRPEDFGLAPSPPGATAGDSAQYNADALTTVLSGAPHPARDAFLLNAAAALVVALELPPRQALERARLALDSKAALGLLERWRTAVQTAAAG